ncbi:MAG: hypothetical protein QXJ68_08220 [Methanocellales archaeon]
MLRYIKHRAYSIPSVYLNLYVSKLIACVIYIVREVNSYLRKICRFK